MTEINLNAGRAARADAAGEPMKVELGPEEFILGSELPADLFRKLLSNPELAAILTASAETDRISPTGVMTLVDAVETVFDAEQLERFRAQKPSTADYVALAAGLLGGPGKPPGSDDSPATGTKPKRTSKRSTASTSPEPVSETPTSD